MHQCRSATADGREAGRRADAHDRRDLQERREWRERRSEMNLVARVSQPVLRVLRESLVLLKARAPVHSAAAFVERRTVSTGDRIGIERIDRGDRRRHPGDLDRLNRKSCAKRALISARRFPGGRW